MKTTDDLPGYVKLGLLGIHTKRGALMQFWTCIGIGIVLLSLSLYKNSLLWTLVFCASLLLTAKWYWSCIQWVEKNSRWEKGEERN